MALIDALLPAYALHQSDHVAVAADPVLAWGAICSFDLGQLRFARALFDLRTAPDRLAARLLHQPVPPTPSLRLDELGRGARPGFRVLAEEPDRELVVGAVGRFWQPEITFADVEPAAFARFAEPGWGKLAWSLRVDPRADAGSWIGFELRVGFTDEASRRRFDRYWRVIGRFSHAIRRAALHRLARELGAPPPPRRLPGDELLPDARLSRTHAITIEAPPSRLWPWLVQMGCRRAGWYSLDALDNAGRPSADHIVPSLQRLAVGDVLPWRPSGPEGFVVRRLEDERLLVLGGPDDPRFRATWAFVLLPIGATATHLLVRVRASFAPSLRTIATVVASALAHEIMERAQLIHLKRRAEAEPPTIAPVSP